MADTTALFGWTIRVADRPTGAVQEWHYVVVDHRRLSWIDDDGDLTLVLEATPEWAKKYAKRDIQASLRRNELASLQIPNPTNWSPVMVNVPTRLMQKPGTTNFDFEKVRSLYLEAHLKTWAIPAGFQSGPQLAAYGWTVNISGKRMHIVVCEELFARYLEPEEFMASGVAFPCKDAESALRTAAQVTDDALGKPEARLEIPEPVSFAVDRKRLYPDGKWSDRYLLSAYQYARTTALRKANR